MSIKKLDNPNSSDENGYSPIHWASCHGHSDIVKILTPMIDNPNTPDIEGWNPHYWAAQNGYTEFGPTGRLS